MNDHVLARLTRLESTVEIHTRLIRILSHELEQLMSDQSHLDSDVAELTTDFAAIKDEIAKLEAAAAAGQPLDFTALDAVVADVKANVPAPPA